MAEFGGGREATLLYSSGSSAEPKGIPLSHRNLVANVSQLSGCYLMRSSDRLLANLPLFHSFGLTGGFWLPILNGMQVVTTWSPLQAKDNLMAIREESVSVMIGTPTFLRPYLKKASSEDLKSLRLVVAGAEKLPSDLAEQWKRRFGISILEGYGMTECAPVISANCLRSDALKGRYALAQNGSKQGSAGLPLPGIRIRIVNPENKSEIAKPGSGGLILVKGPNIFCGYLEPSSEVRFTQDGWLDTGDLGRIDDEGFLWIEGRLSRFSKIGGEMVSHTAVEEAIVEAYPEIGESEVPSLFVGSRACGKKGESLVLLTTRSCDGVELSKRLRNQGLPNLWIPQHLVEVGSLPLLGSGKLDLKACSALCGDDSPAQQLQVGAA
ncbi:AMP-binding protein [Pelagicoccus albus]|uniref:AMP-binding protein n=1 Tax=Pelagicoccus albus TaxID=415222 RepID=A0A7X1B5X1_9BACT|nr:AMP-binding protein [Pelagicoccus albus]